MWESNACRTYGHRLPKNKETLDLKNSEAIKNLFFAANSNEENGS